MMRCWGRELCRSTCYRPGFTSGLQHKRLVQPCLLSRRQLREQRFNTESAEIEDEDTEKSRRTLRNRSHSPAFRPFQRTLFSLLITKWRSGVAKLVVPGPLETCEWGPLGSIISTETRARLIAGGHSHLAYVLIFAMLFL